MSFTTGPATDEMAEAVALRQLDASSSSTARDWRSRSRTCTATWRAGRRASSIPGGEGLAEQLDTRAAARRRSAEALASFAAWGITSTWRRSSLAKKVVDLGLGSGTDLSARRCWSASPARRRSGHHRRAARQGRRLRDREGFSQVELVEARIEELPFDDASFDAVLSNGVINLSRSRAGSSPRRRGSCGRAGGW